MSTPRAQLASCSAFLNPDPQPRSDLLCGSSNLACANPHSNTMSRLGKHTRHINLAELLHFAEANRGGSTPMVAMVLFTHQRLVDSEGPMLKRALDPGGGLNLSPSSGPRAAEPGLAAAHGRSLDFRLPGIACRWLSLGANEGSKRTE